MPAPTKFRFIGGPAGPWRITRMSAVRGEGLPPAERLAVLDGATSVAKPAEVAWILRGVTSNERYVTKAEHDSLVARQEGLGRPHASEAALIPIRKTDAWWMLSQDERRAILEASSAHIAMGLDYLPAIARRLHHGRDLGEPFDFVTWFEYAPEHAEGFEELVGRLRATEEWAYVEREVDIRLARDETDAPPHT